MSGYITHNPYPPPPQPHTSYPRANPRKIILNGLAQSFIDLSNFKGVRLLNIEVGLRTDNKLWPIYYICGTDEGISVSCLNTSSAINSDLERRDETCAGILSDAKHFILYLKKGNVLYSIIGDDISSKISNINSTSSTFAI